MSWFREISIRKFTVTKLPNGHWVVILPEDLRAYIGQRPSEWGRWKFDRQDQCMKFIDSMINNFWTPERNMWG